MKRHLRQLLNHSRARQSKRLRVKITDEHYTHFDFYVMPLGFKRTVHAYFVAPVRHVADFLDPITAAMNIYTACGMALILTTLYTLAHLHA